MIATVVVFLIAQSLTVTIQSARFDDRAACLAKLEEMLETARGSGMEYRLIRSGCERARDKTRRPGRDICRGKGRYYTHGGRSWRCRR